MPRRLRIEIPDGVYHIMNRGVLQNDAVRDDEAQTLRGRVFGFSELAGVEPDP